MYQRSPYCMRLLVASLFCRRPNSEEVSGERTRLYISCNHSTGTFRLLSLAMVLFLWELAGIIRLASRSRIMRSANNERHCRRRASKRRKLYPQAVIPLCIAIRARGLFSTATRAWLKVRETVQFGGMYLGRHSAKCQILSSSERDYCIESILSFW